MYSFNCYSHSWKVTVFAEFEKLAQLDDFTLLGVDSFLDNLHYSSSNYFEENYFPFKSIPSFVSNLNCN